MKTFLVVFYCVSIFTFGVCMGWYTRGLYESRVSNATKRVIERKIKAGPHMRFDYPEGRR